VDAGERIWLSVQDIVAEKFEEGAMIYVTARFGEHVHLSSFVSILCGINARLNFELLNRVN
jgi:hypothetical protein